jgi:uncharacterized membrane protein YtjA (UPF0391 family)
MLRIALGFFIIALIAAFFGYGGIASSSTGIAKLFFIGFLVLAVISVIGSLISGRRRL